MDEIIATENLKKYYRKLKAVDGINLSVKKGEIYGFLGLNGAGKTTTIRMLLGLVRPTSGSAYLKGTRVDDVKKDLWNAVGYLVEIPYSYPDLTVRENLEIIRRLRLINSSDAVNSVIEQLHLAQYADIKVKNLSFGNAQRLGIAKAILHKPEILILDEPANGLDPAGIVEIREMLIDLALNRGVTIFISSHILGEISKFATRIGIIHEGYIMQESDIHHLDRLRKRSLHVNTPDNARSKAVLKNEGFTVDTTDTGYLNITGRDTLTDPARVNTLLVHAGLSPNFLKVEEEDLESYFLRLIGEGGGAI
jgi:ABC-2 type transport system ATP-binding protein